MRQIAPYFGSPVSYKIRQGASAYAYLWICAGGCNAVDGPKDKPDGVFILCRGP